MATAAYANQGNGAAELAQLDYLIEHGANFKSLDAKGRSALHHFRAWWTIGYKESTIHGDIPGNASRYFRRLAELGLDVNLQDKNGLTPLMNAALNLNSNFVGCSPEAIRLLLSLGANPSLKDIKGMSALDYAIERATQANNPTCNEVAKILSNPQASSKASAVQYAAPETSSKSQTSQSFAGTYGGSYNGSDVGTFQVTITDGGLAKLSGRSSKMGTNFTGEGKVSPDGSVAVGSASTGSTFTGSISRSGVLSGTWKNTVYNQAGSFEGKKGAVMADAKPNPIEALGTGLRILNSILAPR